MAIQMRRGEKKDFQPEKLKVGEFAVPTDTGEVYIKTSENTTKGIATLNSNGKLEQMPSYSDVGAAPTSHNHSASSIASGTLPVSRGGTGKSTLENGNILLGNGTGSVDSIQTLPVSKGGTGATTANEALTNLGAVPTSRTVNSKALSADITLTPSGIGAAASSHGNHVPTTQTANNKVFLRNDNTWQTVVPANIGAVATTRKINNKPLSADITLSYSDVGAANEQHNHSASEITSGVLPIGQGGTNASMATEALENLGGVPKTRTINSKALSSDISLTASDVGAATSAQGTKADSAIQGVKVNGTLLTPDSSNVVNVDATSINAATPEQGEKADSAIQGIQGNGTTITPDTNKIVNVTPANIGAVPTSRTISSKDLSGNISLTASGVGAAAASHTHNYILSRGAEAASTGRNIKANGAYTYNTITAAQGGPSTYSSIVGFGNGISGSAEMGVEWAGSNPHCYVRSLRDVTNNWTP